MSDTWKPTRRQILKGGGVLAAGAVAPAFLTACKSSPAGASSEGQVTVWTFFEQVKDAANHFMAKNPAIKLDVHVFPGDQYQTKLRLGLQQPSQAPDIFDLDMGYLGAFINKPQLADLTPLGGEKLIKDFVPYAAACARSGDKKVRGVVDHSAPGGFWYRRDLLHKYLGIQDAASVASDLNAWDAIIDAGQKVARDSNNSVHLLSSYDDVIRVELLHMKNFVQDGKFSIDPAWNEVLNIAREVRKKNVDAKLSAFSPAWGTAWNDGSVGIFAWPSWAWMEVDTKKSGNNWGVAPAPRPYYNGGRYVSIYSGSKKKDAAFKYLQFLASPEWQSYNLKATFNMPSLESVYKDQASSFSPKAFGGQKILDTFRPIADAIRPAPVDEYQGPIQTLFDASIADMINSGGSNSQALESLRAKVKQQYPQISA